MRGSHPQDGGLNPVPRAANLGKIAAVPLPPCPPHAGIDHGFIESLSLDFLLPQRRVSALPVRKYRRDALTKNDHATRIADPSRRR